MYQWVDKVYRKKTEEHSEKVFSLKWAHAHICSDFFKYTNLMSTWAVGEKRKFWLMSTSKPLSAGYVPKNVFYLLYVDMSRQNLHSDGT